MGLPHYSRYIETEIIMWGSEESFGIYDTQDFLKSLAVNDLVNLKVTPNFAGRPDLISQENYGTPYYSWIIVMHNAPLNPIGWPANGSVISIPKPEAIDRIIHG